jgi:hypothetical protein
MKKGSTTMDTTKVLSYLLEVHSKTKEASVIAMSDIARKHRLSLPVAKVLVAGGIISREIVEGRNQNKYTWTSIHPNIKMAEKVCVELSKAISKQNSKKRDVKVETPVFNFTPQSSVKIFDETKERMNLGPFTAVDPSKGKTKRAYNKKPIVKEEVQKQLRTFSLGWGLIKIVY